MSEADLRREIAQTVRSTPAQRIRDHVQAGRCACEIKNPQGTCCLGDVVATTKDLLGPGVGTPMSWRRDPGARFP